MPRKQAVRRTKPPTPGWVWLLGGAVLGALLTVGVMLTGSLPGDREEDWQGPRPSAKTRPSEDRPPEPAEGEPADTQYDFYSVLPEMEVVIPEDELQQRVEQRDPVAEDPEARYLLQAGSFQSHEDADRLKAQLALQGFVAKIQSVTVDGDTWHRVRLGPFDSARDADQARRKLDEIGVRAIALKVKG